MATTRITSPTALADELVVVSNVTSTSEDNVTGSTSGTIYFIEADNTENEYPVYLKIADAASATAGTTQSQIRLRIPKQENSTFSLLTGHAYTSGISLWVTTGPDTSDTGSPENTLTVKLLVTT